MTAPRLESVVVSSGFGRYSKNQTIIESIYNDVTTICAQKPVYSKAKKSIANFNIRDGNIVGVYVTLRSHNMFDFLNRLILIAMPRIQDLQKMSVKSFDQNNNYNFGIKRQDIFPEIDHVNHSFGMNVTIKLRSLNQEQSLQLLKSLGFPFHDKSSTIALGDQNAN